LIQVNADVDSWEVNTGSTATCHRHKLFSTSSQNLLFWHFVSIFHSFSWRCDTWPVWLLVIRALALNNFIYLSICLSYLSNMISFHQRIRDEDVMRYISPRYLLTYFISYTQHPGKRQDIPGRRTVTIYFATVSPNS